MCCARLHVGYALHSACIRTLISSDMHDSACNFANMQCSERLLALHVNGMQDVWHVCNGCRGEPWRLTAVAGPAKLLDELVRLVLTP